MSITFLSKPTLTRQISRHTIPTISAPSIQFISCRWMSVTRAVARGGAGGAMPPPRIPFAPPPRQFSKLSKSRRSVREN